MDKPLVSIIIPCFNAAAHLRQTLESVLWQTYPHWECILVDDGSNDNSADLFGTYQQRDSRFKYIHQKNQGPSAARNSGVKKAGGEYIQFLDADDLLLPNRIEECIQAFLNQPGTDVVYSDFVLYQKGQPFVKTLPAKIPGTDIVKAMLFDLNVHFVVLMHSMMFRRSLVETHPFDTTLPFWAEDQDCWIRMALDQATFSYLDAVLVIYRYTDDNLTSKEADLIASKVTMLERYAIHPKTAQYKTEFKSALLYLRQRLVMGYFMQKSFGSGLRLMATVWSSSSLTAILKMAGWGVLMALFSKKFVIGMRAWIVEHTPIQWGGWKHFQTWTPPQSVLDLLDS